MKKIAIKCPRWLGDIVMATPAIRTLRARFPEAELSVLLKPAAVPLLEGAEWVDRLLEVDEHDRGVIREGLRLRRERFDLMVLLQRSHRSGVLAWLSGASRKAGFAAFGRTWMLTDPVPFHPRVNTLQMYLRVVRVLGKGPVVTELSLPLSSRALDRAKELTRELDTPLVGFVPGASYGPAKMWPGRYFVDLAHMLHRRFGGGSFLIIHAPSEAQIAEPIEKEISSFAPCRRVCTDLGTLKGVVRGCDLVVTNDTGPRHIAAAFARPTVVIMGPTDPSYTDYPAPSVRVVRKDVPCGPCQLRECPRDHACMVNLAPEEVFFVCLEVMNA